MAICLVFVLILRVTGIDAAERRAGSALGRLGSGPRCWPRRRPHVTAMTMRPEWSRPDLASPRLPTER
jgi:hypothetical protein